MLTVDLALAVGGVHGDRVRSRPNRRSSTPSRRARQSNIRDEQIALLPHGRDFTSLVTQAPGANRKPSSVVCRSTARAPARTASSSTARRRPTCRAGLSGKNLIVDFVDEVQVKSSGYTAEYGGAMGGVISAITKSGTNDYHGTALLNFEGSGLAADNVLSAWRAHQPACRSARR